MTPQFSGQWLVGQLLFVEAHDGITFLDVVALEPWPGDGGQIAAGSPVSVGLRAEEPLDVGIDDQLRRWATEGRVVELGIMQAPDRMGLILDSGTERVVINVEAA